MEDRLMPANHAGHSCCHGQHATGAADAVGTRPPATVRDPVCGMQVDPLKSPHRFERDGTSWHFCSAGCRTRFAADPERYLNDKPAATMPPAKPGAIYTCPMHPEVRQVGPGACPICGMALEPEDATAETGPNPELADMTRRFWIAVALAVPVVLLENGMHLLGHPFNALVPPALNVWLQLLLATPVVLWAGWPFFVRGWASLVSRKLNMFTLIALGTGAAWAYSLLAVLAPGLFPAGRPHRRRHGRGLFRSGVGDHGPGPARPSPGAARPRAHRRRHQGAAEPRPQDRAPCARRRQRRGNPSRCRPSRRPPARPPRRPRARRRRGGRGCECRRRIHGHRRVAAGREGRREPGHRRHAQRPGQLRHAGGQGRVRDHARPHRPDGGAGPALARPDPAPGRPGRWLVRPGRGRRRRAGLPRLVAVGTRTFDPLRADRRRLGADHRLPLRAGPRHADVDHGRRWPRGRPGRPDPRRRGAGAVGEGRHARGRQDRHADRRQAGRHRDRAPGRP